ncbi:DUF2628 domain-containing protein [Aestuariivirga litoralis]|uniref:DUF2628 domain-containing protein n=1 Tax=Aestuariivirga litoralis TaxID=2650924 RepID=A0A2W2APV4_9HYPH|nr:DUF2628 domain-containing protein [Aestuariivirga litoralis]PZF77441.1 DUF2628 domain-containing protein [Aestuariivirga litoralis]
MTIYAVLEPPDDSPWRVTFVPEGFSWGAFAFTVIWALWHRLWVVAALLFSLSAVFTIAANLQLLGPGLATLLQFGISLLFAFEARALQVKSLERAGFRRAGLIQASCLEAAELTYFDGRAPCASMPPVSPRRAGQDDPLGIFGKV